MARGKASAARIWLGAIAAIIIVEALLNWASLLDAADYSFSLKVSCARILVMIGGIRSSGAFRLISPGVPSESR